ncbi:MAG: tetratricopeptide repeat protein [Myxococcota bacterium]|nr:tetratricopeptide repeat protein [Myxococcota bacterium]
MKNPFSHRYSATLWRLWLFALLLSFFQFGCGGPDLVQQARSLQASGRFEESLVPLRTLLAEGANDSEVDFLYGNALQGSGVPMMSIWALERAMGDPEWFERAGLLLASGAVMAKEYNLAIDVTDRLIEADPESAGAHVIRAMARVGTRRDYEGAIEDADRALELDPDAVKAEVARTIALLALDRIEEASEGLAVAEEYYASDEVNQVEASHFCAAQVSFAMEKGESEEASEVLARCVESYANSQEIIGQAIEFYDGAGLYDKSIEVLEKAMAESPDVSDYRVGLVLRLEAAGRTDEALVLMEEATESEDPAQAAAALFDLAGYRLSNEDFDGAIEAYEKALEIVPRPSATRLFTFADALIVANQLDRALEVADQMDVEPHKELVYGRVAHEREDYDVALDHFSKGLRLWPDNSVARYLAANAAVQLGDVERAIEEYRYAVRIDASTSDARIELAQLYMADGDLTSALQVIRHGTETPDARSALLDLKIASTRAKRPIGMPAHLAGFNQVPGFIQQSALQMAEVTADESGPEAAVAFLEGLSLDLEQPQNAPVLIELIRQLRVVGRSPDALALAHRVVALDPSLPSSHVALALALEDDTDAAAAFDRAIELNPVDTAALSGRARIAQAGGDEQEALRLYMLAADSEPWLTDSLWSAARILSVSGPPAEFQSALERILERDPYDGSAALLLAQSMASAGENKRALWLARRAARFEASPESESLLKSLSVTPSTPSGSVQPPQAIP